MSALLKDRAGASRLATRKGEHEGGAFDVPPSSQSWMSALSQDRAGVSRLATRKGKHEGGAFDVPPSSQRLISWATRSRCHVPSPNVNSEDLARLK